MSKIAFLPLEKKPEFCVLKHFLAQKTRFHFLKPGPKKTVKIYKAFIQSIIVLKTFS